MNFVKLCSYKGHFTKQNAMLEVFLIRNTFAQMYKCFVSGIRNVLMGVNANYF